MIPEPTWPSLIAALLEGRDLSIAEASWAMDEAISGRVGEGALAGFLVALRAKGETVDELVGFRDAVLRNALELPIDPMALDIVGTGGDGVGTVNVSTTAAIIAAAAGVPVIKHGNRAASSQAGSSDTLRALGLDLELAPELVPEVFKRAGITFVFASLFHPGFRHAGPVRSQLGVPTVFNILGPLCNPARAEANAIGVARLDRVPLVVGVFRTRGATAFVFRGDDGLDELTTTGHSHVWEVSNGSVTEHDLDPRELGIPLVTLEQIKGGSPEHNAEVLRAVLAGERGPVRDIVLLNAAAGIAAYKLAQDPHEIDRLFLTRMREAMSIAAEAVDSGAAARKLDEWIAAVGAVKAAAA